jgi:hypothetical protein
VYQNADFHTKLAEQITNYLGGDAKGKKKATTNEKKV